MVKYNPLLKADGYRAGTDGSIWSCWKTVGMGRGQSPKKIMSEEWHRLKGDPRKEDGRLRYTIKINNGRYRRAYGSVLVLEAFKGLCPKGMESCHNDGDCTNDSIKNLRWGTSTENKADMIGHGTRIRGVDINTAKLGEDDVRSIRLAGYPLKPQADKHGVSCALISLIIRRKVWKHVN
jgi:hypothetical protein